jgi:hypothetical protein
MIDTRQIWQVDEHVRFRRLFDEGVLIHQDQAEAIVLNDTGLAFLELCDGHRNAGDIIDGMKSQFDVEPETLSADLEPFIEVLAEAGIIRLVMDESG